MPFFVFSLTSIVTLYSVKVQVLLPAPPKSLENTEFSRLFCFFFPLSHGSQGDARPMAVCLPIFSSRRRLSRKTIDNASLLNYIFGFFYNQYHTTISVFEIGLFFFVNALLTFDRI